MSFGIDANKDGFVMVFFKPAIFLLKNTQFKNKSERKCHILEVKKARQYFLTKAAFNR